MGLHADALEIAKLEGLSEEDTKKALPFIKRTLKEHADAIRNLSPAEKVTKIRQIMQERADPRQLSEGPPPAPEPAPPPPAPPEPEPEPEKIEDTHEETLDMDLKDSAEEAEGEPDSDPDPDE